MYAIRPSDWMALFMSKKAKNIHTSAEPDEGDEMVPMNMDARPEIKT